MTRIGIVSIATNNYIVYWKDFVISTQHNLFLSDTLTFHIFTDRTDIAHDFARENASLDICIHEIPSLGWPDATLLRFSIMNSIALHYQEDYLLYVDADMKAISKSPLNANSILASDRMTLVSHPGFFRGNLHSRLATYLSSPKMCARDLIGYLKFGGLGSWETNKLSEAFVPRKNRKSYYCGGIWGGPKEIFLNLCATLSNSVQNDLAKNLVAKWHDESHLNRWASSNRFKSLGPEYCFDPTYKNLRRIEGIIEAVNKNSNPIGKNNV